MKKKLLILASIAPLFAFGQEATTFVGEGATVKVKPNTLYHNIGAFKVKDASGNQGKVSNEGKVNVQGDFEGDTKGERFVNEWNSGTSYGQLIIKNGATVTGEITGVYQLVQGFAYHPLATPYSNYKASDLANDLGQGTNPNAFIGYQAGRGGYAGSKYDGSRYKNLVWSWNNENYVSDAELASGNLNPMVFHEVNTFNNLYSDILGLKELVGTPNHNNESYDVQLFKKAIENIGLNKYGESYGTYVYDIAVGEPSGWRENIAEGKTGVQNANNFGNYLLFMGNPYTSNINLQKMDNFSKVKAVLQYSGNEYKRQDGNALGAAYGIAKYWTKDGTGESIENATLVRPYHTFIVKTQAEDNISLGFKEEMKQFEGEAPYYNTNGDIAVASINSNDYMAKPPVYQVKIEMYDERDVLAQEFFVVASTLFQPEGKGEGVEIFVNHFIPDNAIGLYTLQEKAEGGYLESTQHQKLALNGINDEFIGKEVTVKLQTMNKRTFTLKSKFNDDLKKSGYKYYFEDKKLGKVLEITPDFSYTFTESTTTKDRFAMYWRALPETMSISDVDVNGSTIVYKSGNEYGVKFSEDFNRADVYIYNLSGQLISAKKSINANRDYILPYLAKSNVYIVKVVGDNGEVTTKKIIK